MEPEGMWGLFTTSGVFNPSQNDSGAKKGDGEEPALPSMEERRFLGIFIWE